MTTDTHYMSRGFPNVISEMIAEASMNLPPLDKPGDMEFIKFVTGEVIRAFWSNYTATCGTVAQEEFSKITESQDRTGLALWMSKHAHFTKDKDAAQRADMVLEDLAMRLPEILKEEFTNYRNAH